MTAEQNIDLNALIAAQPLRSIQVRVAVLCGLVAILDGIDTQSIAIAAPALAQGFGMKVTQFGLVFSIALMGGVTGAFVCGSLSDAFGRKRVLALATATFAVFTFLTAFAESYESLLAIRFLAGLGLGGAVPCFLALAGEYAPPRRRGTLSSLLWAGFPLGGMLGGFVNAAIIAHYGWPAIFYAGGALPLLVAIIMLVWLPESPGFLATRDGRSNHLRKIAEKIAGQTFSAGTRFFLTEKKILGAPLPQLLTRERRVATLVLWVCFFCCFGLLGLAVVWTPAILLGIGMPGSSTAIVLGFHGLGALFGMGSAGWIVDRFGARGTLVPSLAVAALCTWLLGHVGSVGEAAAVMALIGVFLGLGASGLIALTSYVYPTAMRSTGMGWAMGMGRLGQVIGPLVTGHLMAGGMAPGAVMEFLAILPIIAAAGVLALRPATSAAEMSGPPPEAVTGATVI